MLLQFYPPLFSSEHLWKNHRKLTLFRNKRQLDAYQRERLHYICRIHGVCFEDLPVLEGIPSKKRNVPHIGLLRSGTTSSTTQGRAYRYSLPHQTIMEEHHIWKIETFHELQWPGKIIFVSVHSNPCNSTQDKDIPISMAKECSIYGPHVYPPCGSHNQTYYFYYNSSPSYNPHHWRINLELAASMKPKAFRCSPSTIEAMAYYAPKGMRFDCPVILSEESLTPRVRALALKMFPKVIDKMMCWDGGMGWFECQYERKHVYDEFCFLEEHEGRLLTTDLNNEAAPFLRYYNRDHGVVRQGLCQCGLYGNYFETFEGKYIESLYVDGKLISGRVISELLSGFFRGGTIMGGLNLAGPQFGEEDVFYRIHQYEDATIEFVYSSKKEMSESQRSSLILVLNWLIYGRKENLVPIQIRRVGDEEFFGKTGQRSKSLAIDSDYLKVVLNSGGRLPA